jgi:hypothetical protein
VPTMLADLGLGLKSSLRDKVLASTKKRELVKCKKTWRYFKFSVD